MIINKRSKKQSLGLNLKLGEISKPDPTIKTQNIESSQPAKKKKNYRISTESQRIIFVIFDFKKFSKHAETHFPSFTIE